MLQRYGEDVSVKELHHKMQTQLMNARNTARWQKWLTDEQMTEEVKAEVKKRLELAEKLVIAALISQLQM